MVAETFGLSIAVGVSEENNNKNGMSLKEHHDLEGAEGPV